MGQKARLGEKCDHFLGVTTAVGEEERLRLIKDIAAKQLEEGANPAEILDEKIDIAFFNGYMAAMNFLRRRG